MNASPAASDALTALLAFWHDAGVEDCFGDAPVDRTRETAPPPPARATRAPGPARPGPVTPLRAAPPPGKVSADTVAEAVALARTVARAADSLESLTEAIRGFEACPLSTLGARQAVVWRGEATAPLMIIGEGPGAEEDAQGLPFVGKAGRLLDRMLRVANLEDQVIITNSVFWRPPGNRTPSPEEQAICAPFVARAFELVKPKLVLTVGAAAARAILHTEEGITRLRGNWGEWHLPEGGVSAPVMPTLHPAFLLRQPQAKAMVWADLLTVAARLGVPPRGPDSKTPH
ncbi:uracil-DNA glycosylase [Brevundimonas sp.]|uniref:uracil-DNA glycosylase n=1 Tax=Brevundimonas sp. TaxID=1871086 RepID=UPI001DCA206D|nr:uracil-DNA glycosylase [Brevundimonas sp.]MBL0948484.1 uracil-DNA glycosylase [Brevundimonas sp.]